MSNAALAERLLAPLDRARRSAFAEALRLPWLAPWLTSRDRRLCAQSSLGVLLLLGATVAAPGALYVLGPALFGVLHVASDLRYLVLRRDLPRPWVVAVIFACSLMVLLRAAPLAGLGHPSLPRAEAAVGWGWALAGAVYGAREGGSLFRGVAAGAPLLAAFVAAVWAPEYAILLFAYAHNLVALALWFLLFRRRRAFAAPALALAAASSALFASGALSAAASGPWAPRLAHDAALMMPFADAHVALGVALSYVFLQALHYSVWLAWVPQDDVRGEGTLSFRMSLRSLVRDFGPAGLALVACVAAAVALASLASPHRTRSIYLSLAAFHGYLEVASLAFFVARGRGPAPRP